MAMVSTTVVIVPEIAVPKLLRLSTSLPVPPIIFPIPPVPPAPRPPILLNMPIPGIRFMRDPIPPIILPMIGPVMLNNDCTGPLIKIFFNTPPPSSTVTIVPPRAAISIAVPPTVPPPPKLPSNALVLSANQVKKSPIQTKGFNR